MLKPPLLGNTGEIIPDPGVIGQNKVSGLKGPKTVSRAKTQRRKESVTAGELIAESSKEKGKGSLECMGFVCVNMSELTFA